MARNQLRTDVLLALAAEQVATATMLAKTLLEPRDDIEMELERLVGGREVAIVGWQLDAADRAAKQPHALYSIGI